jgi:hypothetical protein
MNPSLRSGGPASSRTGGLSVISTSTLDPSAKPGKLLVFHPSAKEYK